MYERMLDKKNKPTDEEFSLYCGSSEEFIRIQIVIYLVIVE